METASNCLYPPNPIFVSGYDNLIKFVQVSITALTRGEIRIVESNILGSILINILLVCNTLSPFRARLKLTQIRSLDAALSLVDGIATNRLSTQEL
jgi:hypothetical protein